MRVLKQLLRVVGGRVFWSFGGVTFLMAGLLATVNLASRYALKDYVDGQLRRTPWDFSIFRSGASDPADTATPDMVRQVEGITQVETLAILRAKLPDSDTDIHVDGKPLGTPWLTLMAASDPGLLPPELHLALESSRQAGAQVTPILALVGPERAMGGAFLSLQGAREFELNVTVTGGQRSVFRTPIGGVIRLDRDQLSRWLMDQIGADAYVPSIGVVLLMPYDVQALARFDMLALGMVPPDMMAVADGGGDRSGEASGDPSQHVQKAEYVPEIIHLARIDRTALISGWDIPRSLAAVTALADHVVRDINLLGPGGPPPQDGAEHDAGHGAAQGAPAGDEPPGTLMTSPIAASGSSRTAIMPAIWPPQDAPDSLEIPVETGTRPRLLRVHGPQGETSASEGDDHFEHGSVAISGYMVDSTTLVLLQRMQNTARLIGIVTILVALPLLWMGWMLATNLSALLMLNERRKLGLMRLRGVPGESLGRALLAAISGGGVAGGLLGLLVGSVLPLLIYEGGRLPLEVLLQPQQLLMFLLFLLITVILAVLVSWNLISYATTISPLEASGRFASSETARTNVRFGAPQAGALLLGSLSLAGWVTGFSPARLIPVARLQEAGIVLDFLGLPLFLYGIASLIASRRSLIQASMGPLLAGIGGRLGMVAQRHMAAKPHRSVAFLLIVALMASVCLYPTIASKSFEDKAARGAAVQIGSEWHYTFNSPDLAPPARLRGDLSAQLAALRPSIDGLVASATRTPGVQSVSYMVEALLPSFYLPGYGLNGVPLYLIGDVEGYLNQAHYEPELGVARTYREVMSQLTSGQLVLSTPVADFWEVSEANPLRLGLDAAGNTITAPSAGQVAYLAGMPPRSVTDRQGYVQARVDYLNYLFDRNAYVVAAADNATIAPLQVLIPRVILLVRTDAALAADTGRAAELQAALMRGFSAPPLEMHTLQQEIEKVGSDMFVSLALQNMRIYLIGGLLLALIAILAIAFANYQEDRRTLALIRVRGASPGNLRRFLSAMLLSPALLGLILGAITAVIAGYGLTNYVWKLREIRSVVQLLRTHLVASGLTFAVAGLLVALIAGVAWIFSAWSFRRTANENIREA